MFLCWRGIQRGETKVERGSGYFQNGNNQNGRTGITQTGKERNMTRNEWISVDDALPKPLSATTGFNTQDIYLVARYEGCNLRGYFYGYELAHFWKNDNGGEWGGIDGSCGLSVTHWMRLPMPPAERSEK